MEQDKPPMIARIERHIRSRLLSGLFVIVPISITVYILRFLFDFMAALTLPLLQLYFSHLSPLAIKIIAIVLFVLVIYLVGLITAYVVGRRMVAIGERFLLKIPIVRNIYGIVKQVTDTFSQSKKGSAFSEVVMVEYPRRGLKTVGFVTGSVCAPDGSKQYVIFVPTAPNPTSGFMVIAPESGFERTPISVEDGFKMVVSGGMLLPADLGKSSAPCP